MIGGGGGGGLNTELNLTSMIDLMSVLITFLLMTAVWVHIAAIPASVETKGKAAAKTVDKTPVNNKLEVLVTVHGHKLSWPPTLKMRLPAMIPKTKDGAYDFATLTSSVESVVGAGKELTAAVGGEDAAEYGAVCESIDAIKAAKLESVALKTN